MGIPKLDSADSANTKIATRREVLIVEDETELSSILYDLILPHCDRVHIAENGRTAISILAANPTICTIISDIKMPVLDGLELLDRIRKELNPIPFVVLTAHGDLETLRTAIQLNATDFIEKPFKEADLLRTLNRAIEYGTQLSEFETTLNELFRSSTLSEEEIKHLKKRNGP
jgi:DNA-binding NtrC family response regulator